MAPGVPVSHLEHELIDSLKSTIRGTSRPTFCVTMVLIVNCQRPALNRIVGQDQHPPQGSHSFRISRIVSHITVPGTDAVIPYTLPVPENPGFEDTVSLDSSLKLSQPSRRDLCHTPGSTILYSSRWRPASGQ